MSEKLIAALKQLDPTNENHWTTDGSPRLETVKFFGESATREQVTAAAPGFSRSTAETYWTEQAKQPATAAQPPALPPTPELAVSTAAMADSGASQGVGNDVQAEQVTGSGADAKAKSSSQEDERDSYKNMLMGRVSDLESAQHAMEEARQANIQTTRALAAATAAVDRYLEENEKAERQSAVGTSVFRDYLDAQQKTRDQRAKRHQEWKNIPIREILPVKAAIDEAFQRKNQRGQQRPKAPLNR